MSIKWNPHHFKMIFSSKTKCSLNFILNSLELDKEEKVFFMKDIELKNFRFKNSKINLKEIIEIYFQFLKLSLIFKI